MENFKDFITIFYFKSQKNRLQEDTQCQVLLEIQFNTDLWIELKTFDLTLENAQWTTSSINFSQDQYIENTTAIQKEL